MKKIFISVLLIALSVIVFNCSGYIQVVESEESDYYLIVEKRLLSLADGLLRCKARGNKLLCDDL